MFKNVPARGSPDGWYPFEPVKQMYQEMVALGYGRAATIERRQATRARVLDMWKRSRSQLLAEFDRDKPTHHHARFAPTGAGSPVSPPQGAS